MKKFLIALVLMMTANGAWAQTAQTDSTAVSAMDVETDSLILQAPPAHSVAALPPPSGLMTANGGGFALNGVRISMSETKDFMRPHPEAMKHMRKAQGFRAASMIVSFTGGYLIGWGIGTDLKHKNRSSWDYANNRNDSSTVGYYVGGVALIGLAAGLVAVSVGEWRKAASVYNTVGGYSTLAPPHRTTLALTLAHNGMGLRLTF